MRTIMALGLCLTTAFFLSAAGAADDKSDGHEHHMQAFEHCSKACNDCQRACDSCGQHCARLLAEGKKEHFKTLQTCQDCATHCVAAARITARGGPFADLICTACAEACMRCGKECDKSPDEHMKKCAEECRKCEKACREMLKHTGAADASR
jgi:hypothetical protein